MNLKPGNKVLDIGCGIGGPLRRIAYLTGAHVTGITISQYQIERAETIGVPANCQFIHGDFMELPFENNSFDHVYTIASVCHAPNKAKCFAEIFRVLKPGGSFVGYDWCLTDKYDDQNREHIEIKHLIEVTNALPELKSTHELISDLKSVGFTIEENRIIPEGDIPWCQPIEDSFLRFNFSLTALLIWFVTTILSLMEKIGIFSQGFGEICDNFDKQATALVRGAKTGIFTPFCFFIARKS